MKTTNLFLVAVFFTSAFCYLTSCSPSSAQAPNYLWAKSAIGTSNDEGYSAAADANGNVLVTGYFKSSSIAFGTTVLTNAGNAGSDDMFIVKYDGSGNVLWAASVGGTGNERGFGVAADANGNYLVTGYFSSFSITFETITLTKVGSASDMFIVKYDLNGNVLWAKAAGGTSFDEGISVATDANGNVVVTGWFGSSSIAFGTTTLTNAGSYDMFIVKYDLNGNVLWAKSEGGTSNEASHSVATDANANVVVTGWFGSSSIAFGTTTLTNAGSNDMFIVKYDGSGNVLWAASCAGTGNDYGNSTAVDASGNVLLTGSFGSGSIAFGTTTLTNTNANTSDMFIVKYDGNGNILWAKKAGGTSYDEGFSVATDASGNIFITGMFNSSSVIFGTTTLTNAGLWDVLIVKYDGNGNIIWATSEGGTSDDYGLSAVVDASGNVVVAGCFFSFSITFGTTTLTNAGLWDMFIVKLDGVTGVEESTGSEVVSVYPNPSSGVFTLDAEHQTTGAKQITIYNVYGEKVYETTDDTRLPDGQGQQTANTQTSAISRPSSVIFDLSSQPNGIYFLNIKTGNSITTKKIIVNN